MAMLDAAQAPLRPARPDWRKLAARLFRRYQEGRMREALSRLSDADLKRIDVARQDIPVLARTLAAEAR